MRLSPMHGALKTAADPLQENQLLAALPIEALNRLRPHFERVLLPPGEILHESGIALSHVYFPTEGMVSLLCETETGGSTEVAVIGREGLIGIELFMGGGSTTTLAVVQSHSCAYRLPLHRLMDEFNRHEYFLMQMLRYTQSLITQMAQTAACNRHHNVEQRLCRKLLLVLDRTSNGQMMLTQELIASALGVRREGVTDAAGKLQKAGVIQYRRGQITVLDRQKLEALSCECYSVVKKEADRLQSFATFANPADTRKTA